MKSHLGPLEINPSTKEPFLRLRKHSVIIITPPRETDIPAIVPPLNDERIHLWLGTPYPYTFDHAQLWLSKITSQCNLGLQELSEAIENDTPVALNHSPIRFLREIKEDGSDVFLGDIGLFRCSDIAALENLKLDGVTNEALPAGHPDIVWTIGDFIIPTHQRRGIMTDAVDTLIGDIGKPLMGAKHFIAMVFGGNEGSRKVFLRNNFVLARHIGDFKEVKGFMRDLLIFERKDYTEVARYDSPIHALDNADSKAVNH